MDSFSVGASTPKGLCSLGAQITGSMLLGELIIDFILLSWLLVYLSSLFVQLVPRWTLLWKRMKRTCLSLSTGK